MKVTKTILLLLCTISIYGQNKWVVNNDPSRAPEHFETFAAAHDAATSGDTIYVVGTVSSYGTTTILKPLTIIGTGYNLNTLNDSITINDRVSTFGAFTIETTAGGSHLEGLALSSITIKSSNNTIYRCRTFSSVGFFLSSNMSASNYSINNTLFDACLIAGNNGLRFQERVTNTIVRNCIIPNPLSGSGESQSPVIFDHNYIFSINDNLKNSTLSSNIIRFTNLEPSETNGNSYNNNISIDSDLPTGNGNMSRIDCIQIYGTSNCPSSSSDNTGHILPLSSVAIGAGENGTDVGPFGGSTPYVLNGIPNVPLINKMNIQGISTNNTLNINVKVSAR